MKEETFFLARKLTGLDSRLARFQQKENHHLHNETSSTTTMDVDMAEGDLETLATAETGTVEGREKTKERDE